MCWTHWFFAQTKWKSTRWRIGGVLQRGLWLPPIRQKHYQHTILVIWPKRDSLKMYCRHGLDSFLDRMKILLNSSYDAETGPPLYFLTSSWRGSGPFENSWNWFRPQIWRNSKWKCRSCNRRIRMRCCWQVFVSFVFIRIYFYLIIVYLQIGRTARSSFSRWLLQIEYASSLFLLSSWRNTCRISIATKVPRWLLTISLPHLPTWISSQWKVWQSIM